jgi:hypothetical protein
MQGRPKRLTIKKSKSILNKDRKTRERFNELYNTDDRLSSEYDYAFRDFHIVKNDDYSEFDVEKCQKDLNKQKQEILNKVKQQKQ